MALQLCGETAASSRTPCAHFKHCLCKAVPAFIGFAKQLLLSLFFETVRAARKIALTFIAKPFNKSVISSNAYSWKKNSQKITQNNTPALSTCPLFVSSNLPNDRDLSLPFQLLFKNSLIFSGVNVKSMLVCTKQHHHELPLPPLPLTSVKWQETSALVVFRSLAAGQTETDLKHNKPSYCSKLGFQTK